MEPKSHVAVIGAGVSGLSCAVQLAQGGHLVTVVARELPGDWDIDYASPRAGAHFRPVPLKTEQDVFENELMRVSYDEFRRLADDNGLKEAGVEFVPALEYFEKSLSESDLEMFSKWPGYRLLNADELPSGGKASAIKAGLTYEAWVVNSPVYLKWLQRQAEDRGAVFFKARLSAPQEAAFIAEATRPNARRPTVIVNASGMGFGDPACFPSRGQFILVSNSYGRTVNHHSSDGNSTVIIPRPLGGGCVIGGTKEPNNWSQQNSEAAVREILSRISTICPDLGGAAKDASQSPINVEMEYIGRRPMRHGGLKLEAEIMDIMRTTVDGMSSAKERIAVVHCYGAGPSGYKIGWGAARKVCDLVSKHI